MPHACIHPPCGSHLPGHRLRTGQARHAQQRPWGWRQATVAAVASDGWVDLAHPGAWGRVRTWHHQPLAGVLAAGDLVRLHEESAVLSTPAGVLSVQVVGGLGPVPDPATDLGDGRHRCVRSLSAPGCYGFSAGHAMHWVHANQVGRRPWGWRDGVITHLEADGWVRADYLTDVGGSVRFWHHAPLPAPAGDAVHVGQVVRVHEELHVAATPAGMVNVFVAAGCGPVPTPAEPDLWAGEVRVAVTDNATGQSWLPRDPWHHGVDG